MPFSICLHRTAAACRFLARRWRDGRRSERPPFDPENLRQSYVLTRVLFLRAVGLVYLIAFLSLWVQIDGLVGSQGILPAKLLLESVRLQYFQLSSLGRFLQLPTLCWISAGDGFLHFLCAGGALLSCVLVLGFAPVPILFLLWLFYLSLVNVGQVFLGYQWDALLLEAGFLAIFFSPLQWRLRPSLRWTPRLRAAPPAEQSEAPKSPLNGPRVAPSSRVVLFLLRWLLFRLTFLSGLVKLTSGDPTWRSFTALRYHYETQPLPTWTSWYAHLAPDWFQAVSVGGVFFTELLVPLLFFAPRRLRLLACAMTVLLQLLIAATGNFGFFNLLAIVLCVTLVDDAVWARFGLRHSRQTTIETGRGGKWPGWVTMPLAAAIVLLSLVPAVARLDLGDGVPRPLQSAWLAVAPFNSVNAYGLFASMTTERPELIVQGSDDDVHWLPYEFEWKPGDVYRRPRFCTPHMPRLDWQMWFAALDIYYDQPDDMWLWNFAKRLQEGSPPVLRLLRVNPFPDHPPRYVRVVVYDYHFTTRAQRAQSGAWWRRERLGVSNVVVGPGAPD